MAIKVYSPTDFEDTSSGVSIDGNLVVDTSVLYIDTANNRVGIGTTSPAYKLDVTDAARAAGVRIGRDFSITNRATVRLDSNGNAPADILFGQTALANQTSWSGVYWSISSRESGGGTTQGNRFTIWRGAAHSSPNNSENQFITITPDLKLGIGNANPSTKLSVNGNLQVYAGGAWASDAGGLQLTYDGTDGFVTHYYDGQSITIGAGVSQKNNIRISGSTADNNITFRVGNSERLRITSAGNVGIGTTSPSEKLSVATDTDVSAEIGKAHVGYIGYSTYAGFSHIDRNATTDYALLQASNGETFLNAAPGQSINFRVSNNTKMRINTSGNVGIGTTSPETRLDIQGNGDAVQIRRSNGYASIKAHSDNGGNLILDSHSTSGAIFLNNYVNRPVYIATGGANVGVGNTDPDHKLDVTGDIRARGASPSLYLRDTSVSGLQHRIVGGGNAGLEYHADTTNVGAGYHRWDIGGSASLMYLNESGNLGIGTTSPAQKLEVNGGSSYPDIRISATGLTSRYLELGMDSAVQHSIGAFGAGTYLTFKTVGTDRMLIDASGNVGIGTSSPDYKLHVVGSGYFTSNVRVDDYVRILGTGHNNTGQFNFNAIYDGGQTNTYTPYWSGAATAGMTVVKMPTGGEAGLDYYVYRHGTSTSSVALSSMTKAFSFNYLGEIQFGAYTAGLLKTDANGNVSLDTNTYLTSYTETDTLADVTARGATTSTLTTFSGNVNLQKSSGNNILHITSAAGGTPVLYMTSPTRGWGQFVNGTDLWFKDETGLVVTMVLKAGGNVGIGTTSPSEKLHVSGNVRIEGDLTVNGSYTQIDTDVNTTEQWNVTNDGTGPAVTINQTGAQDIMDVQDDGTSVFYIEDGGNVGIGTTSPENKLSIGATQNGGIDFLYDATNAYKNQIKNYWNSSTDTRMDFNIGRTANVAPTTVMSVGYNGNVGIGTVSPSYKLSVAGTSHTYNIHPAGAGIDLYSTGNIAPHYQSSVDWYTGVPGSGTHRMRLDSSGNLGIGTTSPQKVLEAISGANNVVSVGVQQLGVGQWAGIHFGYRESNASYRKSAIVFERTDLTSNNAQGKIHILNGPQGGAGSATLADAKLTIAENGNVGIGTTSPSEKLDVDGTVKAYSFISVLDPASNNGTFVKVYEDTHKRMYTANLDFSFTAAGTYNFNLVFPNSGGYQYDLTAVNSRGGLYRNFGTLKDSSYIYWESDEDFTHRAEGDLHLISNLNGGMYFSADTTYFLSDGATDAVQTGTANWSYAIVRYSVYIPYYAGDATGTWKLHLTTYGDTGSNVPQFVLA